MQSRIRLHIAPHTLAWIVHHFFITFHIRQWKTAKHEDHKERRAQHEENHHACELEATSDITVRHFFVYSSASLSSYHNSNHALSFTK